MVSTVWGRSRLTAMLLSIGVAVLLTAAGCCPLLQRLCPEQCEQPPACCQDVAREGRIQGTGSGFVSLWIGAHKDTYVDSLEQDRNFGCEEDLRVAFFPRDPLPALLRRTYVHFALPRLPPGTEIVRAYLNLYHPARRGDGTSDDIEIPGRRAVRYWDPCDLTWRTQPEEPGFVTTPEFHVDLRSQAWSGSGDVASLVEPLFRNPSAHEGFVLFLREPPPQKAFWSNNHRSRTAADLGLAPRLVVRVRLPAGTSAADIEMPPLPADNDLGALGDAVLMVRIEDAADRDSPWPLAWDVATGTSPTP